MNRIILAYLCATALASPALAADGTPYVGIEAGVIKPRTSDVDRQFSGGQYGDFLDVRHKLGYDVDGILGYDFGMFRLEGELGYKRARHKSLVIDSNAAGPLPSAVVPGGSYGDSGRTTVKSAMVNALIDLDVAPGTSFYAGGGAGYASISTTIVGLIGPSATPVLRTDYHLKDNDLAWQVIAGARTAVSPNVDFGLKYRYFSAGTLKSDANGQLGPVFAGTRSFVQSHSLLASLIYNFNSPPPPPPVEAAPPPPPPPPPPATQTCPDGTIIEAMAACPPPPAPPPPPPPAQGERG